MLAPGENDVVNPSSLAIDSDDFILVQLRMKYRQRKDFAPAFAERVNNFAAALGVAPVDPAPGAHLSARLRDTGYARVGHWLDAGQVGEILDYFATRRCHNAHVVAQSDRIPYTTDELVAQGASFGSFQQDDVVPAPYLLELANHPTILSAVGDYLGCVPSLYSMNAWWTFPDPNRGPALTQKFHRDEDDFKNCVFFLYLTDTDADACHQYIRHSHRPEAMSAHVGNRGFTIDLPDGGKFNVSQGLDELFDDNGYGPGRDDVYETLFGNLVDSIEGSAGEAFLTDPDGLHRAVHPTHKRRLIVWMRYGMHRNAAYARDLLQPVERATVAGRLPETPTARYVNRLVVAAD